MKPIIIVIGVRSSWDAIAMKSSLRSCIDRSRSRLSLRCALCKRTPSDFPIASSRLTLGSVKKPGCLEPT